MQEALKDSPQVLDRGVAVIEFALFAPDNTEACVRGTFSDWKDVPMRKGEDGYFRVGVQLADGTYEYLLKVRTRSWFYEADSWVDLIDPYAREITADGERGVLHVQDGRSVVDTYAWQNDDKMLPPDHQLVIYELHVGDFCGRFPDLLEKIGYLADLGVNAIELMPVKDNPGSYSWGYNPRHFFAVDTNYGTPTDLKRFVDACHGRGLRVFIDGVYNHAEMSTPLTQIDHDYWFWAQPKDVDNNWGPEFNYERQDERYGVWPARQFIVDTIRYWIQEYHLDGIRYDAVRQIDNFDALRSFVQAAHDAAGPKPFYNVAEYVPQDPAVTNFEGPMDAAWHDNFYHCLIEHLREDTFDLERLKSAVDGRREGFMAAVNMVNYCSNHDHNYVFWDLGEKGFLGPVAFAKRRLGAVLCLTAVGIPLLWMGEEFGEFQPKSEEESRLHWDLLESEPNRELRDFYQALIGLRTSHPALFGDNIDFFYEHAEHGVLAYHRWEGEEALVVLVHMGADAVTVDIPGWPEGQWMPVLGASDPLQGPVVQCTLNPHEARIYRRK